jgi:hypothetical protein
MNVTNLIAMNYAIFVSLTKVKNKPNSNPIKAKTKHVLSAVEWANSNPIQTQYKFILECRSRGPNFYTIAYVYCL